MDSDLDAQHAEKSTETAQLTGEPRTALERIKAASKRACFDLAIDEDAGRVLGAVAASKTAGLFLELGTGSGSSTAWIASGMDRDSKLVTVEHDRKLQAIARRVLGSDRRIEFVNCDAWEFLAKDRGQSFDLIFADTYYGKFSRLEQALGMLASGGVYIVDNLISGQENPSPEHNARIRRLLSTMRRDVRFHCTELRFSTGLLMAVRR